MGEGDERQNAWRTALSGSADFGPELIDAVYRAQALAVAGDPEVPRATSASNVATVTGPEVAT